MNGCEVLIRCGGADDGYVYFYDADQRFYWSDEFFHEMFPALDPTIERWMKARRAGRLPSKPAGYESLYRLSVSIGDFIARLSPVAYDDE